MFTDSIIYLQIAVSNNSTTCCDSKAEAEMTITRFRKLQVQYMFNANNVLVQPFNWALNSYLHVKSLFPKYIVRMP
jgi:hypothetical protein